MLYVHAIGYELRTFFRHSPQQSLPVFVDERDIVKIDNAGSLVPAAPSSPGCSELGDPWSDQAPLHDPPSFSLRLRYGDLQHVYLSCLPDGTGPFSHLSFVPAIREIATQMPKRDLFGQQRNLLICFEIGAKREARKLRVLASHCQATSRLLIFLHAKWAVSGVELSREGRAQRNETCDYAELVEIPSLRIRTWRVDRFIPRRAAAPLGPATTQSDCLSALMIC